MGALLNTGNANRPNSTGPACTQSVASRVRLMAGASAVSLLLAASAPAIAQSAGGNGGEFGSAVGGAGGTTLGGAGGSGQNGAGAGGGGPGGNGGTATGGGGNGGNGGSSGNIFGSTTGGNGQNGADATNGGGGGGGAGGSGLGQVPSNIGEGFNGVTFSGGNGGNGGGGTSGGNGGNGGDGGPGVFITGTGFVSVGAGGTLTGGLAGSGGVVSGGGSAGASGVNGPGAVLSDGGAIYVAGTLKGGGSGLALGHAIDGIQGTGELQSAAGATLLGVLNVSSGATLNLNQVDTRFEDFFGSAPGDASYDNKITGAGAVSITAGAHTVTLTGVSSYAGGTTVTSGTLTITNNSALGTGGVTLSPGTALGLDNVAITNVVTGSGDPDINVTGHSSMPTFMGGAGTTFNILGTDNNATTDQLTVTTTNATYSGVTNVGGTAAGSSVTLIGGATNAFGAAATMNVFTGSVLDVGGFAQTVSSLSGGGTVTNSTGTEVFLTNQGASSTFSGVITDSGNSLALTQNSSGNTLTLTGVNTYHGPTVITAGMLALSGAGSIANSSDVQIGAAGIFDISATTSGATINTLSDSGGAGGGVVLGANTLTLANASTSFSGVISGAGGVTVEFGTQTLAGANTYTGATTITAGTLKAGAADAFSGFSATTVQAAGTLDIGGFDQTVSSLSGAGSVTNSSATAAFLTNQGASSTFDGVISGASLKLLENGGGGNTLTLTGVNTYGGVTVVSAGTLALTGGGSIANSASVQVANGATFDIQNTTNGASIQGLATSGPTGGSVLLGSKTLTITNAANTGFEGVISGTGGVTIAGGNQFFGGVNTYSGETNIQTGGTLIFTSGGSLNAASVTKVVGTLNLNTTSQTINDVRLNGGTIKNGSLAGAVTSTGGTIDSILGSSTLTTTGGTTDLTGTNVLASITNGVGATLNNSAGDTTSLGTFTNNGTVTVGQYPVNAGAVYTAQSFVNNSVVSGIGTINGPMTNNGSIYVGAQNAPVNAYNLTIGGAYSGSGTVFAAADLNAATANTITVNGAVSGSPLLNIAISGQGSPTFFNTLTVAKLNGGGGFVDTPATEAALASASNGLYIYSFGATPGGQGIRQVPNAGVAAAPLTQVTSTIAALNASFFQNSSAFLGQAVCPSPNQAAADPSLPTRKGGEPAASCPTPNQVNFGVWNRDAVGETDIASTSLVQNNAAATPQASHVDTRLAGVQYGLDAGLFNINNSGFNTHLGVTVGDVFTSSTDRANPGVTASAQIPFVGAYGALTGKGFAGIIGVRYDKYDLSLTNPAEGVRGQGLGAHGLTFTTDVQYVIPIGTSMFVEPSAGVYVSRVSVDDERFAAGTASFGAIDSTLSRFGVRTGLATQAGGVLLQPFVAANVYHEWAGDAVTQFTPVGGPAFAIASTRIGTFEQASAGVGWQVPNTGWTGYVRGDAKFGPQVEGWTLTAGLRYNW